MPVTTAKRSGKFRLIESNTGRIAKNKANKALDGGGHESEAQAKKQASAVNISQSRKRSK